MKKGLENVLVIDDDNVFNYLVEDAFEEANINCKVTFKTRAKEALKYLKDGLNPSPELIFLDINMPVMTGWEFLDEYEKIKLHKTSKTKIVMLSSSIYKEDKDKAKEYNKVVDFITKPLTSEQLQEVRLKYLV